jgi:transcriptional regulator with GAF, ATPase, and Fis domain
MLADLMLPEINAIELMSFARNESSLRHHPVQTIVLSGHNSTRNVHAAIRGGARDYMVKPFKSEEVYQRLVFHLRGQRSLDNVSQREVAALENDALMLHLTDLILKQALAKRPLEDLLFNLTQMAALKIDGVRCSLVHVIEPSRGVVVASNDDRGASGIELDLNKYPEIVQVMNFGKLVALENLRTDPHFKSVLNALKDLHFNSLIVCPVQRHGKAFGVLSVRLPVEKTTLADNEVRFAEIVAHIVSLLLGQMKFSGQEDSWLKTGPTSQVLSFQAANQKKR